MSEKRAICVSCNKNACWANLDICVVCWRKNRARKFAKPSSSDAADDNASPPSEGGESKPPLHGAALLDQNARTVVATLREWSLAHEDLLAARDLEAAGKARKTVLAALDQALAS